MFVVVFVLSGQNCAAIQIERLSAIAIFECKNYAQAIPLLDNLIAKFPDDKELYIFRGTAHLKTKNYLNALADFKNAESFNFSQALLNQARTFALNQQFDLAENCLMKHLSQKDKVLQSEIYADSCFFAMKRSMEWKNIWVKNWYSPNEITLNEYLIEKNNQNMIEAYDILSRAIESKVNISERFYYERAILNFSLYEFKFALEDIEKALQLKKNQKEFHFLKAAILMALGKTKESAELYEIALKKWPYEIKEIEKYINVLMVLKELDKASEWSKILLNANSDNATFIFIQGKIFFQATEFLMALELFNKCIQINPRNAHYYYYRGLTYNQSNSYDLAIHDFSASLDIQPTYHEAYLQRGISKQKLNKNLEACIDFQLAAKNGIREAYNFMDENCN